MEVVLEDGRLKIPDGLLRRLRAAKAVSLLTGAGVSAESGVPTFRGADGVWSKYDWRVLETREGLGDSRLVWACHPFRSTESARAGFDRVRVRGKPDGGLQTAIHERCSWASS